MFLFQKRFHEGLVAGSITLTFRRWDKARVRVGGRYRCHPIGVLEVDRVDLVRVRAITSEDARRSGFASRAELVAYLRTARAEPLTEATELYRIELRHVGDGDRVELALETSLGHDDVEAITAKLVRMDEGRPWTNATMALIDERPRVAASQLAAKLGRDTPSFKADVRKLKKLGLTQSFEVGYEISPRGRAYLEARAETARRGPKTRSKTKGARTC